MRRSKFIPAALALIVAPVVAAPGDAAAQVVIDGGMTSGVEVDRKVLESLGPEPTLADLFLGRPQAAPGKVSVPQVSTSSLSSPSTLSPRDNFLSSSHRELPHRRKPSDLTVTLRHPHNKPPTAKTASAAKTKAETNVKMAKAEAGDVAETKQTAQSPAPNRTGEPPVAAPVPSPTPVAPVASEVPVPASTPEKSPEKTPAPSPEKAASASPAPSGKPAPAVPSSPEKPAQAVQPTSGKTDAAESAAEAPAPTPASPPPSAGSGGGGGLVAGRAPIFGHVPGGLGATLAPETAASQQEESSPPPEEETKSAPTPSPAPRQVASNQPSSKTSPSAPAKDSAAEPPEPAEPERVAAVSPPAATAPRSDGSVTIHFATDVAALPSDSRTPLSSLVSRLNGDNDLTVLVLAYASGDEDNVSRARHVSLSRALAVRSYLIDQGVRSSRIVVRALGNKVTEGPPDRVDLILQKR